MGQAEINTQRNIETLRAPRLKDIFLTALLILAGRAQVLGMFPFGTAFFAACFDKSIAYVGITALALSLMTSAGRAAMIKYLVASLVFWIYTRFRTKKNDILDATCCGASMFAGGLVFLLYSFAGFYDILMLLAESLVTAFMYIIFMKAHGLVSSRKKRSQTAQDEAISVAVSVGVMITGLAGINLPGDVSIANIVSVYAALFIAAHGSLAAAGSGGLCIGFMSAMSSSSAIMAMGIFGVCALLANLLKAFGRVGAAIGFFGGTALALLYAGSSGLMPVTLIETAAGAALFVITPKRVRAYIDAFFSRSLQLEPLSPDVRVKEYLTMRLENAAGAFRSLEECFAGASEKRLKSYNKEAAAIFDEVSGRVCEGCPNAGKCWQKDFTRTYRSIVLLLDEIEKKGILTLDKIPSAFREKCVRCELFVMEFNHVYELYKKNIIRTGEAITGRDLAARQYREVSLLMDGMAKEIAAGFNFREDLEESIVSELDKEGITAFEVSVIESTHGRMEVYLSVDKSSETGHIERVLESVLETSMGYDSERTSGLMRFISKAKFKADIAVRQIARDYSNACGDGIDVFTADDYKQYVVISDGMGSGKRAMLESHITLTLLREFLKSGFGVKTAIDMINSALCLKLDYECFSTVDLLSIDLMTGVCEFYKIGGAESILLHGQNVETVFSVSLPVGMLPDVKAQGQAKRLSDGDTIIMMTDGVSEAGYGTARTDWLKREIKIPHDTMDSLAEKTLETAVKKSHNSVVDDMTVAAIRLIEV